MLCVQYKLVDTHFKKLLHCDLTLLTLFTFTVLKNEIFITSGCTGNIVNNSARHPIMTIDCLIDEFNWVIVRFDGLQVFKTRLLFECLQS